MPLTKGRKAIRFPTLGTLRSAIQTDQEYQYRHLVIDLLASNKVVLSRKDVALHADIPINAISKTIASLLESGVLLGDTTVTCPDSGREVQGIKFNPHYKGLY